jgi:hypothetical protein
MNAKFEKKKSLTKINMPEYLIFWRIRRQRRQQDRGDELARRKWGLHVQQSQLEVAATGRWCSHAVNGELSLDGLDLHSKCVSVAQALVTILLYEALGVACCAVRTAMANSLVSASNFSNAARVCVCVYQTVYLRMPFT